MSETYGETRDGNGAGDHDTPYRPMKITVHCHPLFTERQFARLLILRGRVQDNKILGDTFHDGETWEIP